MKRPQPSIKGLTLIELMLYVTVLGTVFMLAAMGVQTITNFSRSSATIGMEREIEGVLYNLKRDVQEAKSIVSISSDTLVVTGFNQALGFDTAVVNIFDPVAIGTITYTFGGSGEDTYLQRVSSFPAFGGRPAMVTAQKTLRNCLTPPDVVNYIFKPYDPYLANPLPPYKAVEVVIRLGTRFWKDFPKSYSIKTEIKSHAAS